MTRPLASLLEGLGGLRRVPDGAADLPVSGVAVDSRRVGRGALFVAVPGTAVDGLEFLGEAAARGAAVAVAERAPAEAPIPVVEVADARRAVAELAASWHGHPGRRLRLVGITGTVGKTSVLAMLHAILGEAGIAAGTIGSLGLRFGGHVEETRNTTPDALTLHRALAEMAEAGADVVAMEVTSHALVQERVHGLRFDLGVFTNLVLLEHMEYHGSFRAYAAAKARFFGHLPAGAPVIHDPADRVVHEMVASHDVTAVGCGRGDHAALLRSDVEPGTRGTRMVLGARAGLPRADGGGTGPLEVPLRLPLLGRAHVTNATLAAGAALCLGARPEHVRSGLETLPAPRRRMQLVRAGGPAVLDDTVGHPDSISAVMEVAGHLPHRRLHAAFAIRGRRGAEINARDAETLAIWARRVRLDTLVVTASEDHADERNRVTDAERAAFLDVLDAQGVAHAFVPTLEAAVERIADAAGPEDLVLLLGAQGMDAGAALLSERLPAAASEPGGAGTDAG